MSLMALEIGRVFLQFHLVNVALARYLERLRQRIIRILQEMCVVRVV